MKSCYLIINILLFFFIISCSGDNSEKQILESLEQIKLTISEHDYNSFKKYVDVTSIISNYIDFQMESESDFASMLATLTKPRLVEQIEQKIKREIETCSDFYVLNKYNSIKLENIEGKTAYLIIDVNYEPLGKNINIFTRFRKLDNYWQLAEVDFNLLSNLVELNTHQRIDSINTNVTIPQIDSIISNKKKEIENTLADLNDQNYDLNANPILTFLTDFGAFKVEIFANDYPEYANILVENVEKGCFDNAEIYHASIKDKLNFFYNSCFVNGEYLDLPDKPYKYFNKRSYMGFDISSQSAGKAIPTHLFISLNDAYSVNNEIPCFAKVIDGIQVLDEISNSFKEYKNIRKKYLILKISLDENSKIVQNIKRLNKDLIYIKTENYRGKLYEEYRIYYHNITLPEIINQLLYG